MTITARPIPALDDNYVWLLQDQESDATVLVDPGEAEPVLAALKDAGSQLDAILLTHHHGDHIDGVETIRAAYPAARLIGAAADRHRLPKLDQEVVAGDTVNLNGCEGMVMETPGHTLGHISYFFPDGGILLCGDTLFSLGCGKLLEGTAAQMFASLQQFAALPDDTLVCCGHEYTQSNARFALTVDPGNIALRQRADQVARLRASGQPTIPSSLGMERAANPFLRAADIETLADLRQRKDHFR